CTIIKIRPSTVCPLNCGQNARTRSLQMRIWKGNPPPGSKFPISQSGLSQLLSAITDEDRTRLPRAILDLVRAEVDMLNCAMFLLPARGQPLLLGHAESRPSPAPPSASNAYIRQHYQRDIAL